MNLPALYLRQLRKLNGYSLPDHVADTLPGIRHFSFSEAESKIQEGIYYTHKVFYTIWCANS